MRAILALLLFAGVAACEKRVIEAFPDEFAGAGVEITLREGVGFEIVKVHESGGAMAAGVRAGDRLLAIDERRIDGLTLASVVDRIRGPVGSHVMLDLEREGKQLRIPIERKRIVRQGESYTATAPTPQ